MAKTMPGGKLLAGAAAAPLILAPSPHSQQSHKMLMHSSYHLVHHHEDTLPHLSHGIGTLVAVLVLIHVVAISYLLYLFSKPLSAAKRRKRGKDLKPVKCENDFLHGPGRVSRNVL